MKNQPATTLNFVDGHFRADTTLARGTSQASFKKSDQGSRTRCDNEIVTVLSKGHLAILKMAAIRPYLLTD